MRGTGFSSREEAAERADSDTSKAAVVYFETQVPVRVDSAWLGGSATPTGHDPAMRGNIAIIQAPKAGDSVLVAKKKLPEDSG